VAALSGVLKDSFLTVAGPYRICTCFPIKPEGTLSHGLNCQGYYISFHPGVKIYTHLEKGMEEQRENLLKGYKWNLGNPDG